MAAIVEGIRTPPIVGVAQIQRPESILHPRWNGRQWQAYAPIGGRTFPEILNITAPNGEPVPVTKCANWVRVKHWEDERTELQPDYLDEVTGPDQPVNTDWRNTTAYRACSVFATCVLQLPGGDLEELRSVGQFDYSRFGYIKIGKVWVDPNRPTDVAAAHQRVVAERDSHNCAIL